MSTRIGFSTPKHFNPVSWLVRKFTGSRASHTFFVYLDVDFDLEFVMEAHELGFRLVPFERFKEANTLVGLFEPVKPVDEGLKFVAGRYLGTGYDYGGLLGELVVIAGRWFKRKWRNPIRSSSHVFCSEAVCMAMLQSPGYEDFKEDPDSVDPQTLLQYFEGGLGKRLE
jgi:hypothetical protein